MFAKTPQLAVPFVFFALAMIPCLFVPGPAKFELELIGKLLYNAFLMCGLALYALGLLVMAVIWQLRILQQLETGVPPNAKTALLEILESRTFSIMARTLPSYAWTLYPRISQTTQTLPSKALVPARTERERELILNTSAPLKVSDLQANFAFVNEMQVCLGIASVVLRRELATTSGPEEGLRVARLHFRELEKMGDIPPVVPWAWVAGAGALYLVNFLLPDSFMSSPAWFFFPAVLLVGFVGYVTQMEWAEVYFRHVIWEKQNAEASLLSTRYLEKRARVFDD